MARQRAGSRLSFRKSSSSSIPRIEASETTQEKHKYQIKGKADPSKALRESQPADIARDETTFGTSLRQLEHRDAQGNVIVDADRSNPTRPRFERPLDTIRSFEAAIDGSYDRRQSFRVDTPSMISPPNRRSSYFNGPQPQRRLPSQEGAQYYTERNGYSRPDSYHDSSALPPTPYNGGNGRRFGLRNPSDSALYGNVNGNGNGIGNGGHQTAYSTHAQQPSNDTVGTASNGSHVTDVWGNSTDPSSENSSIDRVQAGGKVDINDAYGFSGFGGGPQFQGPILEEYGHGVPNYGQPGYGHDQTGTVKGSAYQSTLSNTHHNSRGGAPVPPPKESPPRVPINPGAKNSSTHRRNSSNTQPVIENEKRRSWLKKRFSKG